ncbi:hypothetical protein U9R62_10975 [Cylindrospermopsis raciborskii DSH]|uniref:hypothetical protein n=1 Tax=Cylindrospermopsis raciborskii TaxID=77022 RepID=UPI002EDAA68B
MQNKKINVQNGKNRLKSRKTQRAERENCFKEQWKLNVQNGKTAFKEQERFLKEQETQRAE